MAVLTREEFFKTIEEYIGEDSRDEAISFLENMTDTYEDFESRLKALDAEDWRKKYEDAVDEWEMKYNELDESWKDKYKKRFFSSPVTIIDETVKDTETEKPAENEIMFDDLFEESEEK